MNKKYLSDISYAMAIILLLSGCLFSQTENTNWISHPQLGCSLKTPTGWSYQQDGSGILLSNENISGAILIIPTEAENFDDVRKQMADGVEEEGTSLSLSGKLKQLGNRMIAGEYSGVYEYQSVKAYIIGTHSQYGSGVFILAFDSPENFSTELINIAVTIAKGMKYTENKTSISAAPKRGEGLSDNSGLLKFFTGTYFSYTGGGITSGGTERRFVICENRRFYFTSESSYSGGAGTGDAWGAASQSGEAGTLTMNGNKTSGSITLTYSNGNTEIINYEVCGNGCIYFNNIKYAYEKPAICN